MELALGAFCDAVPAMSVQTTLPETAETALGRVRTVAKIAEGVTERLGDSISAAATHAGTIAAEAFGGDAPQKRSAATAALLTVGSASFSALGEVLDAVGHSTEVV